MTSQGYDTTFFGEMARDASLAARHVVPVLIEAFSPNSVVDIGCGTGTWLAEFMRAGIDDVVGVDGSWVPLEALEIPHSQYRSADLAAPFDLARRFDIVTSLEVAEHIPEANAEAFIATLTAHGALIVFSAAIPDQGGTDHLNEQWPGYWIRHFDRHGYSAFDLLRFRFWSHPEVAWYYAQNMLLFVRRDEAHRYQEGLQKLRETPVPIPGLVHPQRHLYARQYYAPGLRDILTAFPSALLAAVKRRLSR